MNGNPTDVAIRHFALAGMESRADFDADGPKRRQLALRARPPLTAPASGVISMEGIPSRFATSHRVRIDPVKAKDTDAMIRFEFTDANNKAVGLHVRRGVVEYVENTDRYYRKPDFTVALSRDVWAKLYLSQATVAQLASTGEVKITGDAAACDRVLDLFDRFEPEKNTLVPTGNVGRL